MKFKVGDKVKVARNSTNCGLRGMEELVGKTLTITNRYKSSSSYSGECAYGFAETCFEFYERDLIPVVSLPINITFKNKYEHQAVQQFLFDNGCKWCNGGETTPLPFGEKIIRVTADKRLVNADNTGLGDYPTYTINDLDTIKEILNPSKPITEFELNREYTAIIDPNTNTVKVGCQTFPFDKIKELASKL